MSNNTYRYQISDTTPHESATSAGRKDTMKNQNTATITERTARAIERMNNPRTPTTVAERIRKALFLLKPTAERLKSKPTDTPTTAEHIRKATTTPINHRAEESAERKAVFSDSAYTLAKRVVGAKIKGAIRRGATADKNAYIAHYADMVQEASKALQEAEAEAMQYTATNPAEYEQDYYTDRHTPFIEACRACGRLEKWYTSRSVKEGTPIEHISEHATTSGQEKAITEREAVKDWTCRVIEAISTAERMKRITAKQAENMKHLVRGHAERVNQLDAVRKHLAHVLTLEGLLKRAEDGHIELVTD